MTPKELISELLEAVTVLRMNGFDDEARTLKSDIIRAGDDLRELLMVRDDAERLIEECVID